MNLRKYLESLNNNYFLLVFLTSSVVIMAFYYIQYVLGFEPCKLCNWQRMIYFILSPLALIIIFLKRYERQVIICFSFLLLISIIISTYHLLIEYGLVENIINCADLNNNIGNIDDLRKNLMGKINVPCEIVQFKFIFPLSAWNLLLSLLLLSVSFYSFLKRK
jgi:disulfide bond formation protein DsbB